MRNPEALKELRVFGWLTAAFLAAYFLPVGSARFDAAVMEGFHLVRWYAREHVILCLVPAFFIAGAITVFVSQASVMKYLGASAPPALAYGVASISGMVLSVCSCTVLPIFGGIYKRGAGLGPAIAFLYSGPAINVLAIILTARVLGFDMGAGRTVGALVCGVVAGLAMHRLFRKDDLPRGSAGDLLPDPGVPRPLGQTALLFAFMVGVLAFANWGSSQGAAGWFSIVSAFKWYLTALCGLGLGLGLVFWVGLRWTPFLLSAGATAAAWALFPESPAAVFSVGAGALAVATARAPGELNAWFAASWSFAKQVTPLLLGGVAAAGFLLGRPGHEGLIPAAWVAGWVGGNGLAANASASVVGAFMYFATLTEVPILQGLMGSGMGKGPAMALLLAGPALSLPSMLVLRGVMGTRRTAAYVAIVVVSSIAMGGLFGVWLM